ncbi:type VI secretion system domain-containing protein [Cupriavidus basilensis]
MPLRALGYVDRDPAARAQRQDTPWWRRAPNCGAQLKRLMLQKQWPELLDRVEQAFAEGAIFWLDLQYYAFTAQDQAGGAYGRARDSACHRLRTHARTPARPRSTGLHGRHTVCG